MKRDKGVLTSEFSLYFLFAMFVLSMILGVLPVFSQYMKLDQLATEVVREAELSGNTGETVVEHYNQTAKQIGIEPKSISFEGTKYVGTTKNVQINDPIQVTITYNYKWFSSFLNGGFDQELCATATGRSGVYYK